MAQGANQAIEDAVVLAGCLRRWAEQRPDPGADAAADPRLAWALRRYANLRVRRTSVVQRVSRANTRSMHVPDGSAQRSRDSTLAGPPDARLGQWLYGFDAEAELEDEAAG
jgi:salicylate hydroxylase